MNNPNAALGNLKMERFVLVCYHTKRSVFLSYHNILPNSLYNCGGINKKSFSSNHEESIQSIRISSKTAKKKQHS